MADHDALIEILSRAAAPVARPRASWRRVLVWLLLALPCGALATLPLRRPGTDWAHPGAGWAIAELVLAFVLGVFAMLTSLELGIAGRRALPWRWPAAIAVAWLLASAAAMRVSADPIGSLGYGLYCYGFVVLVGAPMAAIAVASLRRTRAVRPDRSLVMSGLGSAFMAFTLLGFCHPVGNNLIDLAMHLAATVTLVAATVLCGRRLVALL